MLAALLAPIWAGVPRGPIDHDGTIVTERPDQMWAGTQMVGATGCLAAEGNATVFVVIDHCTGECLGAHAAR
jgi:putative transposase